MILVIEGVNESVECIALKEWKLSIFYILDNRTKSKSLISYLISLNLLLDI